MYEENRDDILILGWERGRRTRSIEMRTKKDPCLETKFMPKDYKLLVERAGTAGHPGSINGEERANLEAGTPPASPRARRRPR